MILVKYALGMLGVALSVMGTTWTRDDCGEGCGPLAAAQWEANELLPGLAGLFGGMVALAFPFAGAAQAPPVAGSVPADPGPASLGSVSLGSVNLGPESQPPGNGPPGHAFPVSAPPDRVPEAGPAPVSLAPVSPVRVNPAVVGPPSAG